MNFYKLFYLFTVADGLRIFFTVMVIIFTLISVIATVAYFVNADKDQRNADDNQAMARKWMWWCYPFAIVFWSLFILTPSKKDLVLIIAGGAVGEFVMNDENAQKLPADITRFLRTEILTATKELTDDVKESIGVESEADKLKKMSKEQLEQMLLEQMQKSKTSGQ
jgi:hypothetical protein